MARLEKERIERNELNDANKRYFDSLFKPSVSIKPLPIEINNSDKNKKTPKKATKNVKNKSHKKSNLITYETFDDSSEESRDGLRNWLNIEPTNNIHER